MPDIVTFDPVKLLIIEINSALQINTLTAKEIYSEWKDWLLADASRLGFPSAFTPIGGDPTTGSDALGVTLFLENGWRIRPAEYTHKLIVDGNIYARGGSSVFVATVGAYNVNTETKVTNIIDRITVGGIDQATVQAGLTAQGYTAIRAPKLDNLDNLDASSADMFAMLLKLYELAGLDPTKPLVVTNTTRKVPADGSSINQSITTVPGSVTVQRS